MATSAVRRQLGRLAVLGMAATALAGCVGQAYAPAPAQPQQYELPADVLFRFDSANLLPQASAALEQRLAAIRQTYRYPLIRVEGHTDSIGSDAANDALSLRRAEAVRQWLIGNGVPPGAITVAGLGRRQPIAPNTLPNGADNPDGRARNRRVVLIASPA